MMTENLQSSGSPFIEAIEELLAEKKRHNDPLIVNQIDRAIQANVELMRNNRLRDNNYCVFSSIAFTHGMHFVHSYDLYDKLLTLGWDLSFNMVAKATKQQYIQVVSYHPEDVVSYLQKSRIGWVITKAETAHTSGVAKIHNAFAIWNTYPHPGLIDITGNRNIFQIVNQSELESIFDLLHMLKKFPYEVYAFR